MKKQIGSLVTNNYFIVNPYLAITQILDIMLENKCAVVKDEDNFIGVVTVCDLLKNPHLLVIDCISKKPEIQYNASIEKVLKIMEEKNMFFLPVFKDNVFQGIVSYKDVLKRSLCGKKNIEVTEDIIFNAVNDAVLFVDSETLTIKKVNDKTINLFKFRPKDITGQSIDILVPDGENKFKKLFQNILKNNLNNFDYKLMDKKGAVIWGEINVDKKLVTDTNELILTVKDITKRKELEHKLTIKNKLLEEILNKANKQNIHKDEFLTNMSHEIRTPLTSILGYTELILSDDKFDYENKEFLYNIKKAGKRLINMFSNILDITKIDSNKIEITNNYFSLQELTEELKSLFNFTFKEKNIDFNISVTSGDTIYSDQSRVYQILINLIGNAVKFTDKGKINLKISEENDHFLFCVKDTGKGIEKKNLDIIFDRFVVGETGFDKKYQGAGLGLYICKNLVQILGGKIWVKTELGKGTEFYFTIPKNGSCLIKPENNEPAKYSIKNGKKLNIIVTDDEILILKLFKYALKVNLKHSVRTFSNGKALLKELKNNKNYDLIFLDINMPDINGFDCLNKIKDMNLNIPVIAFTAYTTTKEKNDYINLGFDDLLSKPIDFKKLKKIISKYSNKNV